jgi:hypothetical protein
MCLHDFDVNKDYEIRLSHFGLSMLLAVWLRHTRTRLNSPVLVLPIGRRNKPSWRGSKITLRTKRNNRAGGGSKRYAYGWTPLFANG